MKNGMLNRQSYDEIPPRGEYSLAEKGLSIVPILQSICRWSGAHHKEDTEHTFLTFGKIGALTFSGGICHAPPGSDNRSFICRQQKKFRFPLDIYRLSIYYIVNLYIGYLHKEVQLWQLTNLWYPEAWR